MLRYRRMRQRRWPQSPHRWPATPARGRPKANQSPQQRTQQSQGLDVRTREVSSTVLSCGGLESPPPDQWPVTGSGARSDLAGSFCPLARRMGVKGPLLVLQIAIDWIAPRHRPRSPTSRTCAGSGAGALWTRRHAPPRRPPDRGGQRGRSRGPAMTAPTAGAMLARQHARGTVGGRDEIGEPAGIRTLDRWIKSPLLYR